MHKLAQLYMLFCILTICHCRKRYILRQTGDEYHLDNLDDDNVIHNSHYEEEYKPVPYQFGYEIKHEDGNSQWHKEDSDEYNVKKGSYGYTDAHGLYRHVEYIADHEGFRVTVKTNEPGTANSHPAHAHFKSEPPPKHLYSLYSTGHGDHDEYKHPKLYYEQQDGLHHHQQPVHEYSVEQYVPAYRHKKE